MGYRLLPGTMRVSIQNLTKKFAGATVLQDISLEVQDQELFFLLGPSGCGKTTLLRLVAGFYQPDAGQLFLGGRPMHGVPPHRRNTGMVFQNYALWPPDRMAVMREGLIEQIGDPRTVYRAPANRFVADFMGETNWLAAEVLGQSGDAMRLKTELGEFRAPAEAFFAVGRKVWLGFR